MAEHSKTLLGRAVVTILKPLVRILIRNEVTVGDFSELARQVYVDVAFDRFAIPGKKMTFARAAVLTGLSRKEVVRLASLRGTGGSLTRLSPNRAQRVVHGWMNDPEFLTMRGQPRVLPLRGEPRCFADLVARYSGDITSGAILDELLRNEMVWRDHRNGIHLKSLGYIPQHDELEKVHVMAVSAADLLGTAAHNIESGDGEPLFQRQLVYPDVSADTAARFRTESAELSATYLHQLNKLLAGARAQQRPSNERRRVGFGIYYFEAPPDPASAGASVRQADREDSRELQQTSQA